LQKDAPKSLEEKLTQLVSEGKVSGEKKKNKAP